MKCTCLHCNAKFQQSYLRWHAARALKKPDSSSTLTCKKCGCWTVVYFAEVKAK